MVELKTKKFVDSDASCDLRIMFDDETGILHVKWSGSTSLQKFRRGYEMALTYSRTYRANKWLMDLSEWTVLPENIHISITANFFPKILKNSKQNCFVAGVLPVNYYNSVQDWYDSSELIKEDNLLLFNHFLLPEVGLRWLESLS
jgi:hypothetical protein